MDLEAGEQIIFRGHPSWRSILGFYLKGLVLIAAAEVVAVLVPSMAVAVAVGVAVPVLVLLLGYLKRIATTYTITDHRLHIRRGIVAREDKQTLVSRIQNVNTDQSVLQRLLQIGTVDFDTSGSGDFDFTFAGVADPGEVVDAVHKAQRQADAAARTSG